MNLRFWSIGENRQFVLLGFTDIVNACPTSDGAKYPNASASFAVVRGGGIDNKCSFGSSLARVCTTNDIVIKTFDLPNT